MIALCNMIDNPEESSKFVRIYKTYRKTMYAVAYDLVKNVHDAEDIVQGSMESLIDILYKIKAQDIGGSRCKNLMITIAKNEAYDLLRKQNHMPLLEEDVRESADNRNVEELYIEMEDYKTLIRCINELNESYQDVLRLRVFYELSAKETAKIVHTTEENVNVRFMRAKRQLKEKLKESRK